MTVQTRVSLFVELKAKPGKEAEVASFLAGTQALAAAEPLRETHLKGPIAAALMQRGTELLSRAPEIRRAEVLADKLVAGK
jgi:hypothetical protein